MVYLVIYFVIVVVAKVISTYEYNQSQLLWILDKVGKKLTNAVVVIKSM